MKKVFFLSLLAICLATQVMAQKTYVLLTAVSNYSNSANPDSNDLRGSTNDAKELKKVFDKQKNTTVALLTGKNANKENIVQKIAAILELAKPEDKIIFFFSGHGARDKENKEVAAIVIKNGESDDILTYDELYALFSLAKTKNVVVMIDACYSGCAKFAYERMKDASGGKPLFITSSRGDEKSQDGISLKNDYETFLGNGFFTKALLKALRGKADANHDKQLTVEEVFKYVYNDVQRHMQPLTGEEQHPMLIGPGSLRKLVLTKW